MSKTQSLPPGNRVAVKLPNGYTWALLVKRNSNGTVLVWPDGKEPVIVKEKEIEG